MEVERNLEDLFLKKRNSAAQEALKFIQEDRRLLLRIMEYIGHPKAEIWFGAAKTLLLLSEQIPELIYPHFEFYYKMISSPNQILKWTGMDITSNLVAVDYKKHLDQDILTKFYSLLKDESLITAGHAIQGLQKIALSHPEFNEEIVSELIKANEVIRKSECMNIVTGQLIDAFSKLFAQSTDKKSILELVTHGVKSSRNGTKIKAEKFLKKYKIAYSF